LTKKIARCFVMAGGVIIRICQRYLSTQGASEAQLPRNKTRPVWEIKMRKTILTLVGSALIAASATQMAAAAPQHRSHKADRAPVTTNEQFRDSNAAWPAAQPDWSRYGSGGLSAPAGR
jgi:hypothetical protein